MSYHDGSADDLSESDLTIRPYDLNYGFGSDNPIDNVQFFSDYEIIEENKKHKSFQLNDKNKDHYARVFVKDQNKFEFARNAFQNFV